MISKPTSVVHVLLAVVSATLLQSTHGQLPPLPMQPLPMAPPWESESYCPDLREDSGKPIEVGCFRTYFNIFKPMRPEEIDAIYSLYRYGNQSDRSRRWSWDASFNNETADLFKPDDKLAFIIHGFTDNANRPWMHQMKDALFLQKEPEKLNVVLVDWHKGSANGNYPKAARNVMMLARTSAELLHRLMLKYKLNGDNIHLIGHSLGGQTVGQMCAWLDENYGIKIGRATGLDVASPMFAERNIIPDKNHARFFESVHSSSGDSLPLGKFGLQNAFSHLDIYPNGGVILQPGCSKPPTVLHCSHDLSRPYYTQLLIICNKGCSFNVTTCDSAMTANSKACTGPTVDICQRMRYLAENAAKKDNEIVYFETKEDELVSPCNKHWNTTLIKSVGDIVDLVKTGIKPEV